MKLIESTKNFIEGFDTTTLFTDTGNIRQQTLELLHSLSAAESLIKKTRDAVNKEIKEHFGSTASIGETIELPVANGVFTATLNHSQTLFLSLDKIESVLGKDARQAIENGVAKTDVFTVRVK